MNRGYTLPMVKGYKRMFSMIASRSISIFKIPLIAYLLLLLCSCDAEIDKALVIEQNGIVYRKEDTHPFTGYVTGSDQRGYRRGIRYYKKQYKDGILYGKSEFRYKNGELERTEPYIDGEVHGIVTQYYQNGKIKSRIHFVNGMRGGSTGEAFWDRNGHLIKG